MKALGDSASGYFWRGPILSVRRGRRILNWAGSVLLGLGAFAGFLVWYNSVTSLQPLNISGVIWAILYAAPGVLMLTTRARVWPILMMAHGAFLIVAMLAFGPAPEDGPVGKLIGVSLGLVVAVLGWRALRAAAALRRFAKAHGSDVEPTVAVFD